MIGYFNLVNNLNNYVNYYFIIIIVPEKPHWGGSIKYVCIKYVCMYHPASGLMQMLHFD